MKLIIDGNKKYYIIEEGKHIRFCIIENQDCVDYNLSEEEISLIKNKEKLKTVEYLNSTSKYVLLPKNYLKEYVSDSFIDKQKVLDSKTNIFQIIKEDNEKWIVKHIFYDIELRILKNMLKDNKVIEYNSLRKEALEKGLIDSKTKVNLKEIKQLLEKDCNRRKLDN